MAQTVKSATYSPEDKIRIVLAGLRAETSVAELCCREGIDPDLYAEWSQAFLDAGRARLHSDNQPFQAIVEFAPDALLVVNLQGEIQFVNAQTETLFGYSRAELLGHAIKLLFPEPFPTGHAGKLEWDAQRQDGDHFPVEIALSPIDDNLIVSAIRDITDRKHTEVALRENEEKLQTIFNLLPVGATLLNSDKQIVQMNLALEEILALNMSDLLAGHYRSRRYIHPDGTPMLLAEFPSERAFVEQQPILDVEIGVITEDGATIWTCVSAAPLPHQQGVVVVTVDITERNRQHAALQASEQRLRRLAENSPDVIYIMDLTKYQATFLNRTEFLGYSQAEIQSSGSLLQAIHPDDNDRVLAHWREAVISGHLDGRTTIEYRLQAKSGQWRWIQSRETIMDFSPAGKPTQVLVTLTDITQHKQAEEDLIHERDLLRTLIDSSPDYIFIKDAAGRFTVSNIAHAQAVNLTPAEMVGKTADQVFPAHLEQQFHADDQRVLQFGERLINLERQTTGSDGHVKTVLTTKIPLFNSDGQIMGLVGISRDITERKQLADERVRVEVLQRFIRDMSHDFRTPLTIINSSLYLIQKTSDPQRQQVHVNNVEQQIMRIDRLLEELLYMEHLDEDDPSYEFSRTELNAFLASLLPDYALSAAAKHITFTFLPDSLPCFAQIDILEFSRVLMKLMDNALAYTLSGGSITLRTQTEPNAVIISLQDTGIGISPADLPHIFERFYRADQARSTQTGGSGLGLTIAQKIVEAHNGTIQVASQLGHGSTFSVILPNAT